MQRALQGAEEDRQKLRDQLAHLQAQIETLKGKISYRDGELSKLQLQIDRMEKERRLLRNEVRHAQLGQQHTKAELLDKRKENDRHAKSLQEDEQRLARLRKDVDNLMNEKNAISAALTRRNEEYARLQHNLENVQNAYDQSERQCNQCQEDMRLMGVEIKNLRTERNVLRADRESAADLRQELLQMHRLLNQERIKARALQEEMMTPMNVHRWRLLRGKDPEKMDLLERIHILRKQLLSQNVAALEQERALTEAQQLYTALKEFMLKLPSHRVQAQLNTVKVSSLPQRNASTSYYKNICMYNLSNLCFSGQPLGQGSQAEGAAGRAECPGGRRALQRTAAGGAARHPGADEDAAAGGEAAQAEAARGAPAAGANAGALLLGAGTAAAHPRRRLQGDQPAALAASIRNKASGTIT